MNRKFADAVLAKNAELLNVKAPKLKTVSPSDLPSATCRAALSTDLKHIAVNRSFEMNGPDLAYALAHEMRHRWQAENGAQFEMYKPSNGDDLVGYNLQKEEIDAHAWAYMFCSSFFGVRPLLEDACGEEVWQKIRERADEIYKEMQGKQK